MNKIASLGLSRPMKASAFSGNSIHNPRERTQSVTRQEDTGHDKINWDLLNYMAWVKNSMQFLSKDFNTPALKRIKIIDMPKPYL